jgi:protein OS-9
VLYADTVVSEDYAETAILAAAQASSATAPTEPHPTPDTSLHRAHERHSTLEPELRLDDDVATYESMMINGQRYLCSIPRIPPEEAVSQANVTTAEEDAKELARATTRGWELLKDMEENCLYFFSGWWSYSFCHGEEVRQFHQLPPGKNVPMYPPVEDKKVQAYILGRFEGDMKATHEGSERKTLDAETGDQKVPSKKDEVGAQETRERGLAKLETKGEVRYLVQKLKGGTTCDLTGKERRIEVQVRCFVIKLGFIRH